MLQYSFVCEDCEDKTPMIYLMKVSECEVREVECWVCGGVAHKIDKYLEEINASV